MTISQTIIIAIVEGLTEFLPISSTGHMIIAEKLLDVKNDEFVKMFTVAIQLGAIAAVVVNYRHKFFDFKNIRFYGKLLLGVLPAILLGLLFSDRIDELLNSTLTVALSLLVGGIVLLFIDKLFAGNTVASEDEVTFKQSFFIGVWQCLAMIPGVSRSAATIVGGMQQKLTRSEAAEFSFFLAVPTMCAATGYKLIKYYSENEGFTRPEITQLLVGNVVAFIVALLAIRFFIGFVKKHGFFVWGIYRIVAGLVLLFLLWRGILN